MASSDLELKITADKGPAETAIRALEAALRKLKAEAGQGTGPLLPGNHQRTAEGVESVARAAKGAARESAEAATMGQRAAASFRTMAAGIGATAVAALGFQAVVGHLKQVTEWAAAAKDAAAGFGVSVTNMTAQAHALQLAGAGAGTLEKAYRGLALTAENAFKDPGGDTAKRFRELGVELTAIDGQLRPVDELLEDTIRGLAGMTSATERAAVAAELLKVRGTAMLTVLAEGPEAFAEGKRQAELYGAALGEDTAKRAKEAGDALLNFHATVRSAFLDLIPVVTAFTQKLEEAARWWRTWNRGGGPPDAVTFQQMLRDRQKDLPAAVQARLMLSGAAETLTPNRATELTRWANEYRKGRDFQDLPAGIQREFLDVAGGTGGPTAYANVADWKAVIEAEAELRKEHDRERAAAVGAKEALSAMIDEMERMTATALERPQLVEDASGRLVPAYGAARGAQREGDPEAFRMGPETEAEYLQRMRQAGVKDLLPPDTFQRRDRSGNIVGLTTTGPGGIPTEEQRKANDKLAAAAKAAGERTDYLAEGLNSLGEVIGALDARAGQAAQGIAGLVEAILGLIRSIRGAGGAGGGGGIGEAVSGVWDLVTGGGTPSSAGGEAAGGKAPTPAPAPAPAPMRAAGIRLPATGGAVARGLGPTGAGLGGVSPVSGLARTDIVPGLTTLAKGFGSVFLPGMAAVSIAGPLIGGFMSWAFGNDKTREKIAKFRSDWEEQKIRGGPMLAAVKARGGLIEEYVDQGGGPYFFEEGQAPRSQWGGRSTASTTINVRAIDTQSAAEFFRSEEYRRAQEWADTSRAA